ncbi:DUF4430 domain-containing protein [Sporolactobacillus shoreae]|uniref:DUF4430 domain-containing protein n=1 Tax=Sporolactobacillus shoreae TaxID=1465501 RepID=UPI001432CE4E|nr:DUF4430 domain-containing protein [Sporolactobacillus shoreae]
MKNIYRIIIYILAAAILFGAGFFTGHETAQTAAPEQSANAAKNAAALSAVISIKDGSHVLKGKITLSKDETAFSLLQKFTNKQHIEMNSSGNGKMVYVTSLNNKKASKNTGWLFTVNGKQPNVGAGAVKVKKNDQIVWHYSKF